MKDHNKLIKFNGPPLVPVGLDAFLMWDRLPYHRIGVRAYMRSTFDREGKNYGYDGGHFLYQESDTFNVTMDEKGPGVFYFMRANHFHGSPWHYEIDGDDFIVKDTATDDPVDADAKYANPVFIPEALFPYPLAYTWATSPGADLMCVPLIFKDSIRIAYSRTFYGTGYYIIHKFGKDVKNTSRPLESWDASPPDPKALELIGRSGSDIAPVENTKRYEGKLNLRPNRSEQVAVLSEAPSMIRALKFKVPRAQAYAFGKSIIRITWDGSKHASVDAPAALFFGAGHLFNKDDQEYLVKGFISNIRYDEQYVHLSCYWPMPFFKSAEIGIEERTGASIEGVHWEVRTENYDAPASHAAYFHATYTDHPHPEEGKDVLFLDTNEVEGGGCWSGHLVGLSWVLTHSGRVMPTVEGHPRFIFDDSRTPQATGTGTEELAGGGDHWRGGRKSTHPFFGHPVGRMGGKEGDDPLELLNSAYRFFISDLFPFGRRAVIGLKHGPMNDIDEHYEGVAYWYGVQDAALVPTDAIDVCDEADLRKHRVHCPRAQAPYLLKSRFELGPQEDYPGQREYIPEEEGYARIIKGTTEFDVKVDPGNLGVMLRRRFDCLYPNQCAKVWVKRKDIDSEWSYAGEWYSAGSNTFVFSRPVGKNFSMQELAATEHHVRTSPNRWREEEFVIPQHLSERASHLSIKLEHVPVDRDLYPGYSLPVSSAWSESKYTVYCYRLPNNPLLSD